MLISSFILLPIIPLFVFTLLNLILANSLGEFESINYRAMGMILTFGGMCMLGILLGIVSDLIGEKVDQLKKGRARVIEMNHTLILNWTDKTLPVISEICAANESMGGGTIVILAEDPKEELEQRVASAELDFRGTKVIVRSGSPIMISDLKKVSAHLARSIIILARESSVSPDESDSLTLRTVLSLKSMQLRGHCVAELRDVDNRDILEIVGGELVETIVAHDVIGRIMIQAAMQPGLALVLDKVLGFDGSEFYMQEWQELHHLTFQEVFFRFEDAVVLGIHKAEQNLKTEDEEEEDSTQDESKTDGSRGSNSGYRGARRYGQGRIMLNPPLDTVVEPGDKIIVLAEDDDSYAPSPASLEHTEYREQLMKRARSLESNVAPRPQRPSSLLFVGWRRDIDDMILELDRYVAPGSTLTLFAEVPLERRRVDLRDGGLDVRTLKNITLHNVVGSPLSRRHLSKLDMTSFDSVLILADETFELDIQRMDSRSLTSLLLIRDINAKHERMMVQQLLQSQSQPQSHAQTQTPTSQIISTLSQTSDNQGEETTPMNNGSQENSNRETNNSPMSHARDLNSPVPFISGTSNHTGTSIASSTSSSPSSSSSLLLRAQRTYSPSLNREASFRRTFIERSLQQFEVHGDGYISRRRYSNAIQQASQSGLTVISEILDSRTKSLISLGGSSDYVASNELVSKAIAMVAEERQVGRLLAELLSADGNELYVRSVRLFVNPGERLSFHEVAARALVRGEILIGYVKNLKDGERENGDETGQSSDSDDGDGSKVTSRRGEGLVNSSSFGEQSDSNSSGGSTVAGTSSGIRRRGSMDSSTSPHGRNRRLSVAEATHKPILPSANAMRRRGSTSGSSSPTLNGSVLLQREKSLDDAEAKLDEDGREEDEKEEGEVEDHIHINPANKTQPLLWRKNDYLVLMANQ